MLIVCVFQFVVSSIFQVSNSCEILAEELSFGTITGSSGRFIDVVVLQRAVCGGRSEVVIGGGSYVVVHNGNGSFCQRNAVSILLCLVPHSLLPVVMLWTNLVSYSLYAQRMRHDVFFSFSSIF